MARFRSPVSSNLLTLPSPKTLGAFIHARRAVLSLGQAQLAKRAGVSSSIVSLYESNKRRPSLSRLRRLAKALQVDVQILIDFCL